MGTSRLADYFWLVKQETGVDFRSHRLRHTVGTRLVNKGVQLDVIQELLGHADISTTRRYAATFPSAFFQIAARVS
jgi:site-specific recombinase XerD